MSHACGAPIGHRASLSVLELSPRFTKSPGHGFRFLIGAGEQAGFGQARAAALVPGTDAPIALDTLLAAARDGGGLSRFLHLPVLAEPDWTLRRGLGKAFDRGPNRLASTSTRSQG